VGHIQQAASPEQSFVDSGSQDSQPTASDGQAVTFAAGTYDINFSAGQPADDQASVSTSQALLPGSVLSTFNGRTATDTGIGTISFTWAESRGSVADAASDGGAFALTPDQQGLFVTILMATDDDAVSG
jgi:hypothetical protein